MFRILTVTMIVALGLCGCSKNDDMQKQAADSASKAASPANDAASEAGNVATSSTGTGAADQLKKSATDTGEEAKEVTSQATKKTSDETAGSAETMDWSTFRRTMMKCDALGGSEKKQCMKEAKAAYRASHFDCDSMEPRDKEQCRKYGERWKIARTDPSQTNGPAVHSGEPNQSPANPGDPTDELRNRDSTKKE